MSEQSTISWEEAIAQAERSADALLDALDEANAAYPAEVQTARVQFDVKEQLVASFLHDLLVHYDITGLEESSEQAPLQNRES